QPPELPVPCRQHLRTRWGGRNRRDVRIVFGRKSGATDGRIARTYRVLNCWKCCGIRGRSYRYSRVRFTVGLRDVEELMAERGLSVDHTTVWRRTQTYGPEVAPVVRVTAQRIDLAHRYQLTPCRNRHAPVLNLRSVTK